VVAGGGGKRRFDHEELRWRKWSGSGVIKLIVWVVATNPFFCPEFACGNFFAHDLSVAPAKTNH
jgi:hypothetical protein